MLIYLYILLLRITIKTEIAIEMQFKRRDEYSVWMYTKVIVKAL